MSDKKNNDDPGSALLNTERLTVIARRAFNGIELPTADWDIDRLAQFAVDSMASADHAGEQIALLQRQSVVSYFLAGSALLAIRDRLHPSGTWAAWRKERGLSPQRTNYAIAFYERGRDIIEDLIRLSLPDAKRALNLLDGNGKIVPLNGGTRGNVRPKKQLDPLPGMAQVEVGDEKKLDPDLVGAKAEPVEPDWLSEDDPAIDSDEDEVAATNLSEWPGDEEAHVVLAEAIATIPVLNRTTFEHAVKEVVKLWRAMDEGHVALMDLRDEEQTRGLASELAEAAAAIKDGIVAAIHKAHDANERPMALTASGQHSLNLGNTSPSSAPDVDVR